MSDPQDHAEAFDEERIGGRPPVTSDQAELDFPPERPRAIPHADADVTDESVADRARQEEPEVSPEDIDPSDAELPIEEPVDVDALAARDAERAR